jgi:Lamin Tail Domain/CotH kinase protein
VVLPTADATELYKPENLMSDRALPCTVILDEAIPFYRAGVRLKSSEHGRISEARCGYTLEFPSDDLFLGLHDTISLDRSGGVVTGQKEILLKRLENSAGGIYASEDDICRVISAVGTLPAAQYFTGAGITGAAIMSKTRLDKEFLDAQWPNGGDGSQFKYERVYVLTQTINSSRVINNPTFGAGGTVLTSIGEDPKVPQDTTAPPGVNVTSLGANKENYRWYWLLQNNREADDYSGIINVTNAMGTSNQTLMNQYIDVSTWLRGAIPSTLYGVIDNYLGAGGGQHNVLIQFPPGQKAVLIPWDLDFLDQTSPGVTTASLTAGGDVAKFLTNGAWKRLFWGHMLDILNRTFNTSFMTTWATHYSRFGTDDMTAQVSAYLTPRASFAMSQITANIPMVTFARTSASPVTVNTPFATVSGDGWVNVAQIRLLGSAEALAVTWIDDNSWTLQIPVGAGTHTYTLVAYSPTGAQVGSTSVTVTGTGGVFPADAGSLVVSELNYNPTGSSDATEFIELLNITGATLDLSGCHFDEEAGEGIAYTFPSGVQIPPGGRLLVVRDRAAFMAMYPGAGPLAPNQFIGALDNGGETIVLYAASGLEIFRFTYDDSLASTDGGGKSLVRVLSSTNPNPFTYAWRESIQAGGNPGTSDALAFTGSPTADGDGDGAIALLEYGCGTSDNDPGSLPPPPQFIFNGDGTVSVVYQVVPNADDVVTTIESSTDLSSWVPVNGPVIAGQKRYFHLRVIER